MSGFIKLIKYLKAYRSDYVKTSVYSVLNKIFDIMPKILIAVAVDVVVRQRRSLHTVLSCIN